VYLIPFWETLSAAESFRWLSILLIIYAPVILTFTVIPTKRLWSH
jgi:hypothetical protein